MNIMVPVPQFLVVPVPALVVFYAVMAISTFVYLIALFWTYEKEGAPWYSRFLTACLLSLVWPIGLFAASYFSEAELKEAREEVAHFRELYEKSLVKKHKAKKDG